ncbi:MAG: hypothetical protein JZU53_17405 [Paludibacter sp.]|nr:hypothetical protein [Paludibacter sp.]
MKKTFIFSIIFCSFITLWANKVSAQEYKYDLNKYYTPDIVRNSLDLNLNSSGGFGNTYNNPNNTYNYNTIKSNNLSGQFNSGFTQFKNTRKTESLLQLNLDVNGHFSNNKAWGLTNQKTHTSNSTEYIGLNYSKKMYGANKKFFSFGLFSSLNPSTSYTNNEVTSSTTENTTKSFQAKIRPFIGIGIGRIESVKDARQAIYILEDLSKRGVLTRHLSDDEIFKFSQVISQVKNKRFLDYRLHKIDEISTVDSFLVKNNLLTKSDASYFTTLYDNWENSANFERTSGQSFEMRLSPDVNWNNQKSESKISNPSSDTWSKQNDKNYGASLAFNYNYAKQINLNWEKTAYVTLSGSTTREQQRLSDESSQESLYKINVRNITLNGNYRIGYYPSTRTNLSVGISQNFYRNFNDQVTNTFWNDSFNSVTTLRFSAVYYVSPQLSLSGNTSIYNNYSNYRSSSYKANSNQLGTGFSVALKYSFF